MTTASARFDSWSKSTKRLSYPPVASLADSSAKAFTYDAAGRLTKTDLTSDNSQTNVYEFSGVVDKIEYRDDTTLTGTDDFSYDAFLRRTGSTSLYGVTRALAYNDRGQLDTDTTTYSSTSYVVGYDYDDRGRLDEITYPSGQVAEYTFDERSSLETITWDNQQIEDRTYNDGGLLTAVDRPNVDETRAYDNLNRVTSIGNTNVGTGSYTYDANSNKLSESWTGAMSGWNFTTVNGGTYTDGYDAEDRFRNFNQSGQSKTVYLDRSDIGNVSNYKLNGNDAFRSYSNVHELTTVDGASQTFDSDGNLTDAYSGIELGWDEGGLLKQTIVSSTDTAGIEGTNDYGYDARKKRVWKKITRNSSIAEHTVYIYAGPNCIAEYVAGTAASSPSQEYVYAQGIDSLVMIDVDSGSQKLTVTRNQQWSVSALANNANGNVLERYTYDVFGKRTILAPNGTTVRTSSSYDNPYGYTSRRHDDESGLMYYRARYFEPTTGEFTSQDPMEYVDGMSLYRAYFVPNGMDPFGLLHDDLVDEIVGYRTGVDGTKFAIFHNGKSCYYVVSIPGIGSTQVSIDCPKTQTDEWDGWEPEYGIPFEDLIAILDQWCNGKNDTKTTPLPTGTGVLGGVVNEALSSIGLFAKEGPCKRWMKSTIGALQLAEESGDASGCGLIAAGGLNTDATKCLNSISKERENKAAAYLQLQFIELRDALAEACGRRCVGCEQPKQPTKKRLPPPMSPPPG